MLTVRIAAFLVGLLCTVGTVRGEDVDFKRDILPLMTKHCIDCHGPDTDESNLRLDSPVHALRGGNSGEPAIVPGRAERSYLLTRVLSKNAKTRMPPDSPALSKREVALLRAWIDNAKGWRAASAELGKEKSNYWSFQPLQRPAVPKAAPHLIDAFIASRLAEAKISVSRAAARSRLIRRAHLVVHGLPPAPEQVLEFVNNSRPDAWRRLVDELLRSPRYGERMATQWLDLVRFGETHGFETNRERPNAWPFRDWVIDSFNSDKPYDQFVIEQIAGDAVGADVATGFLVAGPYDLVKGADPQFRLIQRQDELADMINTTGTAFLGLTLGCARCHNHKFDPVTQSDYYAMQAVFAGVNHAERALPFSKQTMTRIAKLDGEIAALNSRLAKFIRSPTNSKGKPLRPAVNAKLNIETFPPTSARFVRFTINSTNQSEPCIDELEIFAGDKNVALASAGAKASSSGDFVHALHKLQHINDSRFGNGRSWIASKVAGGWVQIELPQPHTIDRIVWARDREGRYADRLATDYRIDGSLDGTSWKALATSVGRQPLRDAKPGPPLYNFAEFPKEQAEQGRRQLEQLNKLTLKRTQLASASTVYAGTFSQPGPTHRLYRGEPGSPREAVVPAAIKSLTDLSLPAATPERERRLAIAKWIASEKNPLTARVIVNRIWQFHFGTGLVDTPSDFGRNGTKPTHPKLLDWLAVELIENGWSLKHIHRLILTSKTWQQDSRPQKAGLAVDAGTRLLWRFPPRRLDAEGIRDGMLAVTGKLDLRPGGPGFSAFEVEPENVRHYFPKKTFGPDDWRRMVYMTRVRQERDAVFGVFDCPDFNQVVPKRNRSTTPLQALNLLNSVFVMQQSDFFVARLDRDAKSDADKVARAYALCFGRQPTADETQAAITFIKQTNWQQFARAMLNANEFVFIP
jgi:hypothetical protein